MRVIEQKKIENNIFFIRIDPEDISMTVKELVISFSNLSWISRFDKDYIKSSFQKRAQDTADYLAKMLKCKEENKVTSSTGEYVVSELARQALVTNMEYLDIPLAELFKEQICGNPGFDYYSANKEKIIIFGEAKYLADRNAFGSGISQVSKFIEEGQDISDLNDIDKFFEEDSLAKANNGEKAYSIAFSSKATSSDKIISAIKKHKNYSHIAKYKEILFVAVNV